MPFDPTLPVNNSGLNSAQMRAQLTALKALIDTLTATVAAQAVQIAALTNTVTVGLASRPDNSAVLDLIANNAASPVFGMPQLSLAFDDPPTSAQLDEVRDKINELMSGLQTH